MNGSEPTSATPRDFSTLLALEPHGPDTFVGVSPPYDWGRIFGGQVIAQALWAAAATVPAARPVHSLHAYFILGGRLDEPVRYEVDRVRNGRSFMTRRVIARQSYGAILTLEASFHLEEPGPDVATVRAPLDVPGPDELPESGWGWMLERREVPTVPGSGRAQAWVRVDDSVGDDPVRQACALAFATDTGTVTAVRGLHPKGTGDGWHKDVFMEASLDHAVWFHRPVRTDRWVLIDVQSESLTGVRGLTLGRVFDGEGRHVATVAQEALLRERVGAVDVGRTATTGDGPVTGSG
ncbi:MAG: acyl-CoA thioesterase domain-containing protein [Ilumatobacteraceae bacterium]